MEQIDLHHLSPDQALRKLRLALAACRSRRLTQLLAITGRGWGNLAQEPVLRPLVEQWLAGPEGKRLGVLRFERQHAGGALLIELQSSAPPR